MASLRALGPWRVPMETVVFLKNIFMGVPKLGRRFGSMIFFFFFVEEQGRETMYTLNLAVGLPFLTWHHGWKQASTNLPCKLSTISKCRLTGQGVYV